MSSDPESKPELVPITDQIQASVDEAVREPRAKPTQDPPPNEPPPLEVEQIEPLPGPWEPPSPRFDMKRALKWMAVVSVLVLSAGAFLILTDTGRGLLPSELRPDAKKVAHEVRRAGGEVERRAKEATEDEFYTFTDDDGVVHIVDDLEKVPREHRARAKRTH